MSKLCSDFRFWILFMAKLLLHQINTKTYDTRSKNLAFAGSLRKDSANKKTVKVAAEGAEKAVAELPI